MRYEIRVEGHLDSSHAERLGGLSLHPDFDDGQPITVLSGSLADQAALHGVLNTLQALGVVLLDVQRLEPLA